MFQIWFVLMTYLDDHAKRYEGHRSLDGVLDIETSQISAPALHILLYSKLLLLSIPRWTGVLSLNVCNV